jgi:hypothetical protein
MRDERFEVTVTFDERRGYVATAPDLRSPVTALSLGGLCRRIEVLMLPDDVDVRLILDASAERERNRRRQQARALPMPSTDGDVTCPIGRSCRGRGRRLAASLANYELTSSGT